MPAPRWAGRAAERVFPAPALLGARDGNDRHRSSGGLPRLPAVFGAAGCRAAEDGGGRQARPAASRRRDRHHPFRSGFRLETKASRSDPLSAIRRRSAGMEADSSVPAESSAMSGVMRNARSSPLATRRLHRPRPGWQEGGGSSSPSSPAVLSPRQRTGVTNICHARSPTPGTHISRPRPASALAASASMVSSPKDPVGAIQPMSDAAALCRLIKLGRACRRRTDPPRFAHGLSDGSSPGTAPGGYRGVSPQDQSRARQCAGSRDVAVR